MICAISKNFRIPIANFEANVPKGSEVTTCSESSSCFLFLMCILNFTVFFVKEENSASKIILVVIQFTLQVFFLFVLNYFNEMYYKSHLYIYLIHFISWIELQNEQRSSEIRANDGRPVKSTLKQ